MKQGNLPGPVSVRMQLVMLNSSDRCASDWNTTLSLWNKSRLGSMYLAAAAAERVWGRSRVRLGQGRAPRQGDKEVQERVGATACAPDGTSGTTLESGRAGC